MDTPPPSPIMQQGDDDHRLYVLNELQQNWNQWKQQADANGGEERLRIARENEERRSGMERLAQVWLAARANNR